MKVTKAEIKTRFMGWDLVIPKGTRTSHMTAVGVNPSYNFVDEFDWVPRLEDGSKPGILLHDLTHYGINLSADEVEEV